MSELEALLRQLLLALSVAALTAASLRAAAAAGARGLERLVAGAALAAGAAVLEALLLGLVGLGGHALALAAAALLTALASSRLWPRPPQLGTRGWWRGLRGVERLALGALAGAALAWTAWLARYPALGHDMIFYHLAEAVGWVHNGSPGSVEAVVDGIPVGSYPLVHEVLLAWGLALSDGFGWVPFVTAAMVALCAAAGWLGLRELAVPRLPAGLAVAALVLTPAVIASQSGGASVDPAALAWVVSAGALAACARRRPLLAAPAFVAAGLAAGTKTTALPLAVVCGGLALWPARGQLRRLRRPLAAAGAAALALAGLWYLRNLLDHGSPLWPYLAAPWGDPRPPLINHADVRFLQHPRATVTALRGYYADHFLGPLVLLAGALAAPLMTRRREVRLAALAALASLLLWTNAPLTGLAGPTPFFGGTGDSTRYLLPGIAAAGLAIALAARAPGRRGLAATVLLGLAALASLCNSVALGFPNVPGVLTPLGGMALGGLAAAAIRARRLPRHAAPAAAVVAATVAGALASDGFVERHAETGARDAGLARWLARQPAWRGDERLVASSFSLIAPASGDRLQHRLDLLTPKQRCGRVRRLGREGWLVIDVGLGRPLGPAGCLRGRRPSYADRYFRAYAP